MAEPPERRPADVVIGGKNSGCQVTITPQSGARIRELRDRTGHNWLVDTGRPPPSTYEAVPYVAGTRGGWDECVPSVSACVDPNPTDTPRSVHDHGDFWAMPWTVDRAGPDCVALSADRPGHPLRLEKTVRVTADGCRITLVIINRSRGPYRLLYSAHPLFAWDDDVHLDLPGAGAVRSAFGPTWPAPLCGSWPWLSLDGRDRDLSRLNRDGTPGNAKVFVQWSGTARLTRPTSTLQLRQNSPRTQWLGVCVNRGAWPAHSPGPDWIALEATTAPTDSLTQAVESGQAITLGPGRSHIVTTSVSVHHHDSPPTRTNHSRRRASAW